MIRLLQALRHRPLACIVLAFVWTLLIFIGCSLPGTELPKIGLFDHFDKLLHLIFFFVFFVMWFLPVQQPKRYHLLLIFLLTASYGLALEYYQLLFVTGRSFDVWDVVADMLGAAMAWLLLQSRRFGVFNY